MKSYALQYSKYALCNDERAQQIELREKMSSMERYSSNEEQLHKNTSEYDLLTVYSSE